MSKYGKSWHWVQILPSSAPAPTPAKLGWNSLNLIWDTHPPPTSWTRSKVKRFHDFVDFNVNWVGSLIMFYSQLDHDLFMPCSWLFHVLFTTCSWLNPFKTCSPLYHFIDCLFMTFFMTCSQLVYDSFKTCSRFMTCL